MSKEAHIFKTEIGGREVTVEIGKYCELSNGSCIIRCGDTVVMTNVTMSESPRPGMDFFPLGVDFEEVERVILLKVVDRQWMDHIDAMDALRRGIGLKAYGNQDPVIAYKQEGFAMFDDMINRIHEDTVALLMRVNVERAPKREGQNLDLVVSSGGSKQAKAPKVNQNENKNVGRNDPCPCGSGKKFKNCHGRGL